MTHSTRNWGGDQVQCTKCLRIWGRDEDAPDVCVEDIPVRQPQEQKATPTVEHQPVRAVSHNPFEFTDEDVFIAGQKDEVVSSPTAPTCPEEVHVDLRSRGLDPNAPYIGGTLADLIGDNKDS